MANDDREPALKSASADEMANVLAKLVETGQVSAEAVNALIDSIREETAEKAKAASEIDEPLTPEQQEQFLSGLKSRFNALSQLHEGISWTDVEKSLKAHPDAMQKLHALDEKGHAMNVFGEENGELIFASGWSDYKTVSEDHRNIVFDKAAQDYLAKRFPDETCNGNAVDIAMALGVDLADPNFHEQLRKVIDVNGWAWLKTDDNIRKTGGAFDGGYGGITRDSAYDHVVNFSFRAALRVKKS